MAWIPKYIVSGGMYGRQNCPAGSLTGLISICPNSYTNAQCAFGTGGRYKTDPDYVIWAGAYGMTDALIKEYMLSHDDFQQHTFDLVEIDIKNPQGAQYYRQSIVFKATTISETQEIPGSDPDSKLKMLYYEISLSAYRREYPTPYSAYTDTSISDSIGLNGYYYISGDEDIGGWLYYLTDRLRIALGDFTYDNRDYFGIALYKQETRCDNETNGWNAALMGVSYDYLNAQFGLFDPEETDDPNEEPGEGEDGEGESGESGEGGGDGEHDRKQDPVPYPDDPPISGASAGFITMYEMTENNMQQFATELFDYDWWQAVKNFFADPMDFICGVMIVPFAPRTSGHACPVFHMPSPAPDIKMSHYWPVIQDQYQDIDCGAITIPKYYDSCFDYNPYTSVRIYLPYLGYKDLDPDEVMGNTIHVKYKVDCMTGDCIAFIIRNAVSMPSMVPVEQCIAQFSGNCGVRVAFGRQSFDAAIAASVQLMTGIAGGIIRGGASAIMGMGQPGSSTESDMNVLSDAAKGASGMSMPSVESMKTQVLKSGVMGSNAGFMAVQKPFIIRSIPRQSRPDNYRYLNGYPSNIAGPIGARGFRGYMEIEKIQLEGIDAFEQEKAELEALLRGGVLYGNA